MIDPKLLVRSAFLALALVIAAPFAGQGGALLGAAEAQAQTVGRIDVQGNRQVDDATVIAYLTLKVGDRVDAAALQASTQALDRSGLFTQSRVTFSGFTLTVSVKESNVVAAVLFEGNSRFSDAQLSAMIDTGSRGTFTSAGLAADVESIRLAYVNAGYTNASVTSRVEPSNGRTRVTIVVNEGDRAGIAAINFTGNNSIASGTLKNVLLTKESWFLSWLFKDDAYDAQKLAYDREMIRLYYANHGFPDAQVTSAVAEFDPGRNAYFVNFTIIEGERYTFGDVSVETSIAGLNTDALGWSIRTRQGDRYSYKDLQETTEEMAFEATGQGYSFADVRPRIDRDVTNRRLNIVYLVDEGARIYVERINISGNDKTRDFVIRRELDFGEGDPFNRSLVLRGKSMIEALGFFERVEVTTEGGSAPDRVVINIAVVEKSTGEYGLTAGYSTTDGILGEISVTERNFLGRGQYVRVALGASGVGQSFDFSFTEPRFMGLRVSSGLDVYHRIVDETASNYYGTTSTGGQLRFGVPITRDISGTVFGGYEYKTIADAEVPNSSVVTDGQVFQKAFVGYQLAYNGLDDMKNPTSGLYATFSQTYAGVSHNYLKSEIKARYFMPILEEQGVIGSIRGQAGIINDFSGAGVHPTEAFVAGPQIVRGYEVRGFGPRLNSGEALGFTSYAALSAEIEAPVPLLPETWGLSAAIFGDVAYIAGIPGAFTLGGLATDVDAASVDPFKASVGASLIWDSPFGPIRGDYAFVLTPSAADRQQAFSLTLQNLL